MKRIARWVLLLLLTAIPCSAGVVFQFESRELDGSSAPIDDIEISSEGRFLRMDTEIDQDGNPQSSMIYDAEGQTMTIISHDDRSYMVMDRETMESMGEDISNAMSDAQKQMEQAMANMPPEQREMMKKMMKDRMPAMAAPTEAPTIELERTSRRETVGEYSCTAYDVLRDGRKVREYCVSPWSDVKIPAETVEIFKSMGEFFHETLGALAKNMPGGGEAIDNPLAELDKLGGFPVLTREFVDGEAATENKLSGVERRELGPETFVPPADYTEREIPSPRMGR